MMKRVDEDFKNKVFEMVALIPKGRVMTYGQLAALAGAPWAAWEVGQIAHFGPSDYLGSEWSISKADWLRAILLVARKPINAIWKKMV